MSRQTFTDWRNELDIELVSLIGIGGDDLPDVDYWSYYQDGIAPAETAAEIAELALSDDL